MVTGRHPVEGYPYSIDGAEEVCVVPEGLAAALLREGYTKPDGSAVFMDLVRSMVTRNVSARLSLSQASRRFDELFHPPCAPLVIAQVYCVESVPPLSSSCYVGNPPSPALRGSPNRRPGKAGCVIGRRTGMAPFCCASARCIASVGVVGLAVLFAACPKCSSGDPNKSSP